MKRLVYGWAKDENMRIVLDVKVMIVGWRGEMKVGIWVEKVLSRLGLLCDVN